MRLDINRASAFFGEERLALVKHVFARDGLDDHLRLVCCISCLQALGDKRNLIPILDLAVNDRRDLIVVYEVLLQGYLFCGYPRAIESFFALQEVVSAKKNLDRADYSPRQLDASEKLMRRGLATAGVVHGSNFARIKNKISALCPDLGYLMVAEGYGHILSRPEIDLKTRELAVVSSLSAVESYRQLNSHIRGCRNVGCEDAEIYEAIFTCLLWLPAEWIAKSLEVWSEITGRAIPESVDNFIV
jgi:4-carboxymuconolactone decarboxylase